MADAVDPGSPKLNDASPSGASTLVDTDADQSAISSVPPSPAVGPRPSFISRATSFSSSYYNDENEMDQMPPLDRLTIFDFLENLALPQRLERIQNRLSARADKVKKQQESTRRRVVDEWRKRIPPPDEQLHKYRKQMKKSVDNLGKRWSDSKNVTLREKVSFIAGVLNIFISGYLVGAFPEYYHLWYSAQLCYFYPIRFYTYHKRGYHYFLVDLCYFVNLLLILSIWVFPSSKRLFISAFCLAFGNNAVAIAMWRNSLVFHSLDKVTSLFIHIMPCVTMHCLVHLLTPAQQLARFPAIYNIMHPSPEDPNRYTLATMIVWATLPYAFWQLAYHFLITVRRREKIAAGRPTSFTWLRRSYRNTWLGKIVLALPDALQEPAFMLIQYIYALLTMMPCPLWLWFRYASAGFLMAVFTWSVYNGAVYYIDVFGTRFQKELDQLKREVARYQVMSPELVGKAAQAGFGGEGMEGEGRLEALSLGAAAASDGAVLGESASRVGHERENSLDSKTVGELDHAIVDRYAGKPGSGASTGVEHDSGTVGSARERGRGGT